MYFSYIFCYHNEICRCDLNVSFFTLLPSKMFRTPSTRTVLRIPLFALAYYFCLGVRKISPLRSSIAECGQCLAQLLGPRVAMSGAFYSFEQMVISVEMFGLNILTCKVFACIEESLLSMAWAVLVKSLVECLNECSEMQYRMAEFGISAIIMLVLYSIMNACILSCKMKSFYLRLRNCDVFERLYFVDVIFYRYLKAIFINYILVAEIILQINILFNEFRIIHKSKLILYCKQS